MERQELEQLIKEHHPLRPIAAAAQVSYTAVSYWMKRWGLKSEGQVDAKKPRPSCLHCGLLVSDIARIYCSIRCQHQFRRKSKVESGETEPRLLKRYLQDIREHKCEVCGITEWMGKPAPLELDHKDGDSRNNVLSNLRLICPNCHAQTESYKNRNKGRGRFSRRERYAQSKSY